MDDLQGEFEKLAPGSTIDMWELGTVYPLNWIPENAINPRREALIGAYSILYVIYKTVQDGGVPDIERIGEMCEKSENFMPHTSDFIKCGGTVGYIARELTMQVEADIRGEAYNVDSEELVEALNSIPPCALDADLYYWRQALGML
ncbi:hypothetical protein GGI07_001251 [Coemansia sp. Benny D115]|nr:hypothetical protein GGI07_001251 [Coemansia sp. Benny D115]